MSIKTIRLIERLRDLGFTFDEALKLRRIEMALQRWGELECGDGNEHASWAIERENDEPAGKPYLRTYYHDGRDTRHPIPDREQGALKRLAKIMAGHPGFVAYHQTDPRGCALYIVHKPGIVETGNDATPEAYRKALNEWVGQNYNRGVAVCD